MLPGLLAATVVVSGPAAASARFPTRPGPIVASVDTCSGDFDCGYEVLELWLLDPRDRSVRVPRNCGKYACEAGAPVYSPTTRHIAFSLDEKIAIADAAGRHVRVIPPQAKNGADPLAWSPNGRRLLIRKYSGGGGFDGWLYIVDVRTKRVRRWRRVGRELDDGLSAAWSRTGRIAWTTGNGKLYLTDRSGRRPRLVLKKNPDRNVPGELAFSPGGHTLAFVGCTRRASVCLLSVDRSHARIRGLGRRCESYAITWRPDGRKILCIGDEYPWLIDVRSGREHTFHPFTGILSRYYGTFGDSPAWTTAVTWEAR